MNITAIRRAATFATVAAAMRAAHGIGDYWTQSNHQAVTKGQRDPAGARACAAHVATYTAGCTLAVAATSAALGLRLPLRAQLAAQVISAGSHYLFDRRWTAQAVYALLEKPLGKATYANVHGGAEKLDQTYHELWITVAALVAAALA